MPLAKAKRKSPGRGSENTNASKKAKTARSDSCQPNGQGSAPEEHGIILRQYYPPEMSNERALAYANEELRKPFDELTNAANDTADQMEQTKAGDAVVHWFKTDLRVHDNRALSMASEKARAAGVALIGLYVVSPQDWEAHLAAPARVDFVLRTLKVLKDDLAELNIPLWVETAETREQVSAVVLNFMNAWGANHVFANMEYEVDELRREASFMRSCANQDKSMSVVHDTCVVPPGRLTSSSSGRPYAVYTPWFRAWKKHLAENANLLDPVGKPETQPDQIVDGIAKLFDCPVPDAPKSKRLNKEEAERFCALWPAGEHEATERLASFCAERLRDYGEDRDMPSAEATSALSPYLATGAISARAAVATARDRAGAKSLEGGHDGFCVWVSEIAWRDFYRHVLVEWPYVCMNKPFKLAASNIPWSYNREHFAAWAEGRTGYPIVDAAMRQLRHQGWMHNRSRMVAASFLAKDLLLDWRLGEKFFMESLIDGDFASNNGGWGFAAGVGVDPQPYFRILNPVRQSERFDADGTYIRRWVPELRDSGIEDAMIHDPYTRGAEDEARKAGYPEPIVQHRDAREKALVEYKKGLAKD